jgi:hypothetical protein
MRAPLRRAESDAESIALCFLNRIAPSVYPLDQKSLTEHGLLGSWNASGP